MPKFFMFLGFWVGRFADEENRAHVHVLQFGSRSEMKIWLEPEIEVEYCRNINPAQARKILAEVRRRKDECIRKWHECNG